MACNNQNPRLSYSVSKLSSVPARSVTLQQSANQRSSQKAHLTRAEGNWVALPERAFQPFSSAVQFVSTTLKPLTEPSISYPSGPLPNHLSRANSLLSSSTSRLNSHSASAAHPPSIHSNGALKRSRTTTSSTHPTSMSRKRSKSDFGSSSYRPGSSDQPAHEKIRPVILSAKNQGYGSSSSLAHLNVSRSTRQRSRTPDPHNPAFLIRQKQRLAEASNEVLTRTKSSTTSPYPLYNNAALRSSSSLKSSASVNSIGTLYPSRSRAHSQLNTIPCEHQEEDHQLGPVRKTYLGGVGVYLNHTQGEDDDSQDEDSSPKTSPVGHSRSKPNLTINVGLCKNGTELSKHTGSWYNRLLLSPLSSAGSSVYSFFVNSTSPLVASDSPEEIHDLEDSDSEKDPITKVGASWKQSFQRHM